MDSKDVIRIMCPNLTCKKVLAVPQAARGKTIRCRSCSMNIKVPEQAAVKTDTKAADPKAA
ncbi:MAG: hypothetical protein ACK54H_10465 [Phycisphaerales bacterium]|jgi:hypothetical protein